MYKANPKTELKSKFIELHLSRINDYHELYNSKKLNNIARDIYGYSSDYPSTCASLLKFGYSVFSYGNELENMAPKENLTIIPTEDLRKIPFVGNINHVSLGSWAEVSIVDPCGEPAFPHLMETIRHSRFTIFFLDNMIFRCMGNMARAGKKFYESVQYGKHVEFIPVSYPGLYESTKDSYLNSIRSVFKNESFEIIDEQMIRAERDYMIAFAIGNFKDCFWWSHGKFDIGQDNDVHLLASINHYILDTTNPIQ